MPGPIRVTDDNFMAEAIGQDTPVLAYFHDPADEACEFMNLVIDEIARQKSDLKVVTLDGIENPDTISRFSIPLPPVCMVFRNDVILGYHVGKLNAQKLGEWIERSVARKNEEGVKLHEFTNNLEAREQRQHMRQQATLRSERRKSFNANAIGMIGGAAMAITLPLAGFGALGLAILAYHSAKTMELHRDKTKAPGPAKSVLGRAFEIAGNGATAAGSFGLIALAFSQSAPLAAAGIAVGTLMMLTGSVRAGHRIGTFLPLDKILHGSLRKHTEERLKWNPDRPLEEFSPPEVKGSPSSEDGPEP